MALKISWGESRWRQEGVLKADEDTQQLLLDFKSGNQRAFRSIFDRLAGRLTRYLMKVYWTIPYPEIEDIVAAKFTLLYARRGEMKSLDHIFSWMFLTTIRAAVDWIRKDKKIRRCPIDWSDSDEGTDDLRLITFADTSEHKRNEETKLLLLKQGIESLPPQRKKIMELLFFGHKTPQQIAKIMGLTHQTVLNHKTKAIETLQQLLRPKYKEAVYG